MDKSKNQRYNDVKSIFISVIARKRWISGNHSLNGVGVYMTGYRPPLLSAKNIVLNKKGINIYNYKTMH